MNKLPYRLWSAARSGISWTLILFGLFLALPALAEDWTVNGKDYHNVKVRQVEADRVHITYDGGIGTVMIADLTPDLKKRFNYDPVAAKTTVDERNQQAAQADAMLAAQMKQQADDAAAQEQAKEKNAQTDPVAALKAQQLASFQAQLTALQATIKQQQSFADQNHGKGGPTKDELAQRESLTRAITALGGTPQDTP